MALHVRADRLPFECGIDTQELYPTSQLLSEIICFGVQPNKAIVGRNAFAHEAGIHQHGVLSNPLCYEIMTPESVGVPGTRLVLGKHSGRHALGLRCEELGFHLERRELDAIYRQFLALADRNKVIADAQILDLVRKHHSLRTAAVSSPSEGGSEPLASQFPLSYLAKGAHAHADPMLPRLAREHEGEQQEDYLWGV